MSSIKRKFSETTLNRRVRARRATSDEELEESLSDESSPRNGQEISEDGSDSEGEPQTADGINAEKEDRDSQSGSSSESEPEDANSISFGALAKAHASLQRPAKSTSRNKEGKPVNDSQWAEDNEAKERKDGRKDRREFNRSSKHAPTEISSKKAVSRKREVVPVTKREYRDPRFETLSGDVDESKVRRAYSFLDDYRDDEMKELKTAIKKSKDEGEKERMKRTLLSMESRKKAQDRKNRQDEVLARHKKEEKELVMQGKKPFYLKDSEKKKRVILDQYKDLKGGQLDRVIERRRKKVEGKEKKNLPFARRDVASR